MSCNIGTIDQALRFMFGIALLGSSFYFNNYWGLVGLIPLTTATLCFCPLYALVGVKTNKATDKA